MILIDTMEYTEKSQQKHGKKHHRAASYSFSSGIMQSKKKKINIMGGRNKKRRQSTMNNMSKSKSASYNDHTQEKIPRSLPPEKIFGIEDLKENDDILSSKYNNNKLSINLGKKDSNSNSQSPSNQPLNKKGMGSISRSKSSSNTILNGKNLLISTSDDHGIVIMQQHHRMTSNPNLNVVKSKDKRSKTVVSINLRNNTNNNNMSPTSPSPPSTKPRHHHHSHKNRKHHHSHHRRFFHELTEYNIVVADFKKYLLQFSPIIKYSRCLVVGADGLPKTLRDFSKLRWVANLMTIEYLALEKSNDSIACEILNSFAHSLKYLSIRGDIDESLDLYDLTISALRIALNFNQSSCEYLWAQIPSTIKYLCLFKTIFDVNLLNKSLSHKTNLYNNLLHLSLIDCTLESKQSKLILPPSLISLHIKNFQGNLSLNNCQRLFEIVLYIDMKGYNQLNKTQLNVINIAKLMESLEVTKNIIHQIVFFEYNNYDEMVVPSQLLFSDWKNVENLFVVVPPHWLNDDKFKLKFEGSTFTSIKKDICYYYTQDDHIEIKESKEDDDDDEEHKHQDIYDDEQQLLPFNLREKEFRKELRQRVGYSMFADFYNNNHIGEFNLSKFVRNGHHQLTSTSKKLT